MGWFHGYVFKLTEFRRGCCKTCVILGLNRLVSKTYPRNAANRPHQHEKSPWNQDPCKRFAKVILRLPPTDYREHHDGPNVKQMIDEASARRAFDDVSGPETLRD